MCIDSVRVYRWSGWRVFIFRRFDKMSRLITFSFSRSSSFRLSYWWRRASPHHLIITTSTSLRRKSAVKVPILSRWRTNRHRKRRKRRKWRNLSRHWPVSKRRPRQHSSPRPVYLSRPFVVVSVSSVSNVRIRILTRATFKPLNKSSINCDTIYSWKQPNSNEWKNVLKANVIIWYNLRTNRLNKPCNYRRCWIRNWKRCSLKMIYLSKVFTSWNRSFNKRQVRNWAETVPRWSNDTWKSIESFTR